MESVDQKSGSDEDKKVRLSDIFMYADWIDYVLMVIGTLGSIGDGVSTNCILVFASKLMNSIGYGDANFMRDVEECSLYFVFVGLAVLLAAFAEGYCWCKTSERQVVKIRYKYLESVLRQDVGFFDSQPLGEDGGGTTTTTTTVDVINNLSKDSALIEEVLSEKVPFFVMHSSVFLAGITFSAYFSWRLSLVAYPTLLLLVIPGFIYGNYLLHLSRESYMEYGRANVVLSQALSSIKTIYSLTAEKTIIAKYASILDRTTKLGIKQGIAKGLAVGSNGVCFAIWAFLAWYGSLLVMHKGESGGRIYASGISFILGGLSLGIALPELKHFTEASVAASRIFQMINRVPEIEGGSGGRGDGIVFGSMRGEIEFEDVTFRYPSRPNSVVLKEFQLKVEAGKTVALVGPSGSGKSTVIALLQRFYDVGSGAVKIDGVDIRALKLSWVRGEMGLVSQDNALFNTSIRDNISFGKADEVSMEEVIAAASAANAHDFISQLPYGYETKVGEGGALLSGGQKQRIAIARALIRKPKILLLDEATSALDFESEMLVQNALEQASIGRTTLVVAHKLSTVGNADLIAVVSEGRVVETGLHEDLINRPNGHYAKLAKLSSVLLLHDATTTDHSSFSSTGSTTLTLPTSSQTPHLQQPLNPMSPKHKQQPQSFWRLLSLTSPTDWKHGIIGSVFAATFGAVQPFYALTVGGMISAFFIQDHNEMRAHIRAYSVTFSVLCFFSLTFNLLQHYNFACMGECLTRRVRIQMLSNLLTFEPAWFDDESGDHSSGALCSRLGQEAGVVKSLVVDRLSLLVQTGSSICIAIVMGLVVAWRLAVVMIVVQPLTILCFYTRKVLLSSMSAELGRMQHKSTQIAAEAVCNHKVVAAYGCSGKVMAIFKEAQEEPRRQSRKKAWLAGAGIGSAQCLTFMCWALDFWYGGKLVKKGQISAGDVFKTFFILVSSGKVIAEAGSMTSDIAKGVAAVSSVFEILDRQSLIHVSLHKASSSSIDGEKLDIKGWIELTNVEFVYPSRGGMRVLRGMSLEVRAGSSMGLVGRSGCGKSTVIGLIQRLYEVETGCVRIDGVDIRELDLLSYRSRIAVVNQDPIIFAGNIRDNIFLGNPNATEDEMVEAARAANAHDFISALKDGYDTECGDRGVQLSGGQKQRIAIARAVIRNPIILLLDEATSALDMESERVVQQALNRIMAGRTTLVVAHRLNTIKDLDCISLLDGGIVVETGTYAQLHAKKGAFFNFANLQHH